MKIGLLTYFWDENPGTLLQAYSLLTALRDLLPDDQVELIDYRHSKKKIRFIRNYLKINYVYNDYKRKFIYDKFKKKFLVKSNSILISDNYEKSLKFVKDINYDVIVVGSDTVWQISQKEDRPNFPNIYWIPPDLKCKKIAFAVSSNKTVLGDVGNENRKKMQGILNDFSLIGVRDKMTFKLLSSLVESESEKITRVPDPTFLLDPPLPDIKIKHMLTKKGITFKKPIIGINYPPEDPLCYEIIKRYKKIGFQILSFTVCPFADVSLPVLGPFEWANVYKYLNFVITDRFHGTIFSLKNKIPVIAIDWSSYRYAKDGSSKTQSLLEDFGLANSFHFNRKYIGENYDSFFENIESARNNFDTQTVENKLISFKNDCLAYLHKIKMITETSV